jgi:hypothetical protein
VVLVGREKVGAVKSTQTLLHCGIKCRDITKGTWQKSVLIGKNIHEITETAQEE